jgi:hypothetical protein
MIHTMRNLIRVAALVVLLLSAIRAGAQADKPQPIRLHPSNPHYFLFHGQAVVLITSGEHYGAVMNADFDYHRYLAALEADGLNYTRLFGGSYLEVPGKSFGILRNDLAPLPGRYVAPWARSETPGYAGGGNKFDLSKWNLEYFARYRDFLSEAAKRGIVVEVTLFSSHYDEKQWQVSALNSANNVNGTDGIDWKEGAHAGKREHSWLSGEIRAQVGARSERIRQRNFRDPERALVGPAGARGCDQSVSAAAGARHVSEFRRSSGRIVDRVAGARGGVDHQRRILAPQSTPDRPELLQFSFVDTETPG